MKPSTPPETPLPSSPPQRTSRLAQLWPKAQLLLSIALTLAVLAWLLWGDAFHVSKIEAPAQKAEDQPVRVAGKGLIAVTPGSVLEKKLEVVPVAVQLLGEAALKVTGSVVAQLRPGNGPAEDRWQFSSADLLSAYADWRKAASDLDFVKAQLVKVQELFTARMAAQTEVVDRLRKLVAAGTDSLKDLRVEEAKLKEADLQGRKDVYEAENAVRVASRNQAALERQLFQNGVDPHLMGRAADGTAIVVADVPEAKVGFIEEGRACEASFYGIPGQIFAGKVGSLSPILSKERRTLRALFELRDPKGRLRPGMFADVGLGTDPRKTVLIPAEAVLHVGVADYVLIQADKPSFWKVVEVKVGEQHTEGVEILKGLVGGERVIGPGAILLKPVVVRALLANEGMERQGSGPPDGGLPRSRP